MSKRTIRSTAALAVAFITAAGLLAPRSRAARGQDSAAPAQPTQVTISMQRTPPKGAIVLFSGKAEEMQKNWYKRETTEPPPWIVDPEGVTVAGHTDIVTKAEFGDMVLHIEFRDLTDALGKCLGDGNSGVGLQGRYEVQIFNSYGKAVANAGDCGAMYSQVPPRVNVCRKPGEWQTYDIIFRAPRLADDGTVVEKPRATVFWNGVLVQDNTEIKGPTGIQYGDFKGMPAKAPLDLQGNHDVVQFRNIWVVPL
jgi:hypothetical protein